MPTEVKWEPVVPRAGVPEAMEPCCECGQDYPRADLLAGEVFCPKCREVEAKRKAAIQAVRDKVAGCTGSVPCPACRQPCRREQLVFAADGKTMPRCVRCDLKAKEGMRACGSCRGLFKTADLFIVLRMDEPLCGPCIEKFQQATLTAAPEPEPVLLKTADESSKPPPKSELPTLADQYKKALAAAAEKPLGEAVAPAGECEGNKGNQYGDGRGGRLEQPRTVHLSGSFTESVHVLTPGQVADHIKTVPLHRRGSVDAPDDATPVERAVYHRLLRGMEYEDRTALYARGGSDLIRETVMAAVREVIAAEGPKPAGLIRRVIRAVRGR